MPKQDQKLAAPDFRPLGDRVLVKPTEADEMTETGIFLPGSAQEAPLTAVVVAVTREEDKIEPGDVVAYPRHYGTPITLEGTDYLIFDAEDLLGIVGRK